MTIKINLPITIAAPVASKIVNDPAIPAEGLADLLLFTDGTGTAVANAVSGRPPGVIEHPTTTNNAYSWLIGGGVVIEGTEIVSAPAFDASVAWSIVQASTLIGSTGGTGSERIGAIMSFREFGVAPLRGLLLLVRNGGNDWSLPAAAPITQVRMMANGSQGTFEQLLPNSGVGGLLQRRVVSVLTHDGNGNIASAIYRFDGTLVSSDAVYSAHPISQMFLNAGVTLTTLTPCAGSSSATYAGGRQQIELFARYSRAISGNDVAQICIAATELCKKRGRYGN